MEPIRLQRPSVTQDTEGSRVESRLRQHSVGRTDSSSRPAQTRREPDLRESQGSIAMNNHSSVRPLRNLITHHHRKAQKVPSERLAKMAALPWLSGKSNIIGREDELRDIGQSTLLTQVVLARFPNTTLVSRVESIVLARSAVVLVLRAQPGTRTPTRNHY